MILVLAVVVAGLAACGGQKEDSTAPSSEGEGVISSRSAVFQKYSGKGAGRLHIAEFGTEANSTDRQEAQSAIDAYLQAIDEEKWEGACGMVSQVLKGEIAEVAAHTTRAPRPSCGEILKAIYEASRGVHSSISAPRGVASLRVREGPGGGFALFHGSDGEDYWITVKREAGTWKVLAAAPSRFAERSSARVSER
jgi:hypothetical protein